VTPKERRAAALWFLVIIGACVWFGYSAQRERQRRAEARLYDARGRPIKVRFEGRMVELRSIYGYNDRKEGRRHVQGR
jgi:hypothetical protein